jgi:hypothetical protein
MIRIIVAGLLMMAAAAIWRIGGALNSDAIAMAVGVLLGVGASVAIGVLMLAGERRRQEIEPCWRCRATCQAQRLALAPRREEEVILLPAGTAEDVVHRADAPVCR